MSETLSSTPWIAWKPTYIQSLLSIATTSTLPRWQSLEAELDKIAESQDDWDGMGASAASRQLVEAAGKLLRTLRYEREFLPPSAISATPGGKIMLEWQLGKDYLEAELVSPGGMVEWMEESDGKIEEWTEVMFGADATAGSGFGDQAWQPAKTNSSTPYSDVYALQS